MADPDAPPARRPLIERVGLFGIALVFAALFAVIAAASFSAGELFLALLGALGAVMTIAAGFLTLVRG